MTNRFYWDACVLLSFINGDSNRLPDIKALMLEAQSGTCDLYTSTISIAEVAFGASEQSAKALDPATEKEIEKLWRPPSPLMMIDVDPFIGHKARDLLRDSVSKGWGLKPLDAIHLATATFLDVTEIHTYDTRLTKYAVATAIPILEPKATKPQLPTF